jgi:hypothetical protein
MRAVVRLGDEGIDTVSRRRFTCNEATGPSIRRQAPLTDVHSGFKRRRNFTHALRQIIPIQPRWPFIFRLAKIFE